MTNFIHRNEKCTPGRQSVHLPRCSGTQAGSNLLKAHHRAYACRTNPGKDPDDSNFQDWLGFQVASSRRLF